MYRHPPHAHMPPSKWKTLSSAYRKRRTAARGTGTARKSTRYARPTKKARVSSKRVRTSPSSAPNVYHFSRGFDSFASIGASTGIFTMNLDAKYQVINLRTKFSDLPDYTEFNALFSEYKIKNFTIKLVPTYSSNQPVVLTSGENHNAIPNYQVFAVPVNYTDDAQDFAAMTGVAIDSFLNQTQRKSMNIMPNRPRIYVTNKPRVPKYEGPLNVGGGTSTIAMARPYWLSTGAPVPAANQDERNVLHYGLRILIRRVDGAAMTADATPNPLGFRVHHQVNFMMRKVQ